MSVPLYLMKISKSCGNRAAIRTVSTTANKASVNLYTNRTHNCGQLTTNDVGKTVDLFGWVQYTRFNNKIIALRDSYGSIQCIVDSSELAKIRKSTIPNESILHVSGTVRPRPNDQINPNQVAGHLEVLADTIDVVNRAADKLPISTSDKNAEHTLVNRLEHRYIDLRGTHMQYALRFRSQMYRLLRDKLYDLKFVECETPTLYNRTPGGANEFVVPTQMKNKYYSLVQSPQQLKQMLMIGGLDRYFQICRCYRDEGGRPDRQPEFTQLDIELSFTNQELIMQLIEDLMYYLMSNLSSNENLTKIFVGSFDGEGRLSRMTYRQAMDTYGTDKPDLRFDWKIETTDDNQSILEVPYDLKSEFIEQLVKNIREELYLSSDIETAVHCVEASNSVIIKGPTSIAIKNILGKLRCKIATELESRGVHVYKSPFSFVWITDFPLFDVSETGQLESNHHPFTAPTEDTIGLLDTDPTAVLGQHYDLVLNGQEIAGGSMRIHDAGLQRRIFNEFLKVDDAAFSYFLEALQSGCPPHGGIAFGLDRLVSILINRASIREVIAFPKTSAGRDLVSGCPHDLDPDVKRMYHID